MYDKDSPVNDGKIESTNLTQAQKNYAEVLSHIGRVAKYVEMRNVCFWVEKPNGYREMLNALEKEGKSYDNLTPVEQEKYEKKYRYEKITSQRIGGSQVFLQNMLYEAHQDEAIKKIWKTLLDEIKMLASKEATDYFDGKNEKDLK